jgi:hypothetical protein
MQHPAFDILHKLLEPGLDPDPQATSLAFKEQVWHLEAQVAPDPSALALAPGKKY